MLSTFNRSIITLDFYANQKYIAGNLCVNRTTPSMHCDGKCQLQKKLKQEDNKDKQNPERRDQNSNLVISSKTFFAQLTLPLHTLIKKKYFNKETGTSVDQPFQFFHPPQEFFV